MDGLIAILIMIGAIVLKSSKMKKKANQQASRNQGFREADEALHSKPNQPTISKEKWVEYLMQSDQPKAEALKPKPAKPKVKAPKPAAAPRAAEASATGKDPHEGTVSTQGESEAEHAEHRRRILAEEAQRREAYEAHRELQNLNLKRLRSAIVTREILDKPVSLRAKFRR